MIIGLTGKARAGKDTVARILCKKIPHSTDMSFAGPIKRGAMEMFNLSPDQLWGDRKEEPIEWLGGVTPRHILQTLGTEFGRPQIHPDVWVMNGMRTAEIYLQSVSVVVITDVRFDNEAEAIIEAGGKVYEVFRPGNSGVAHHSSEEGISRELITAVINNSGTLDELEASVCKYIQLPRFGD